jgi:hypothetical protein
LFPCNNENPSGEISVKFYSGDFIKSVEIIQICLKLDKNIVYTTLIPYYFLCCWRHKFTTKEDLSNTDCLCIVDIDMELDSALWTVTWTRHSVMLHNITCLVGVRSYIHSTIYSSRSKLCCAQCLQAPESGWP